MEVGSSIATTLKDSLNKFFSLPAPFLFDYDIFAAQKNEEYKRPYYPFSEGAEKYYNYEVLGRIKSGMMDVLQVKVTPKFVEKPAVEGTFLLDYKTSYVVSSDFVYNDAAKYSYKKDEKGNMKKVMLITDEERKVSVKKDLYYSTFWLPEVMEEEFYIRILGFKVKVHRTIEFSDYTVNVPKFKEIKPQEKIIYSPQMKDTLLSTPEYSAKLTKEEEEDIIEKIENEILSGEVFDELIEDMTELAKESAKNKIKEKGYKYYNLTKRAASYFQYNRVEGPYVGIDRRLSGLFMKNSAVSGHIGYGFEDYKWKWELAFLKLFGKKGKLFAQAKAFDKLGFEEDIKEISDIKNTFTSLAFKYDYRDYYGKKGYSVGLGYKFLRELGAALTFVSQKETNVTMNTNFSVFNQGDIFRLNPDILAGTYNGIELGINYRTYRFNADLKVLYTDEDVMKSDFSYTQFKFKCRYKYRPTHNGKFYLTMNSGLTNGAVSPQRWFDFGGKVFGNYTGELRGVGYKEFTGDRMFSGVAEYHLKARALKKAGFPFPLLSGTKFILWSGIGWSELSDKSLHLVFDPDIQTFAPIYNYLPTKTTDGTYYEYGIGISDLANIFRLDFIHTSIDDKVMMGFNILR